MDARRPLLELDRQMINWFGPTGKPIHCLLTKSDKLNREEQAKILRDVRAEVANAGSPVTAQLFSSLKKTGMEEAEKVIGAWLDADLFTGAAANIVTLPRGRGRGRAGPNFPEGVFFFAEGKKRKPPAKGEKPGVECLNGVKAPAQGGEAGDGRGPSVK